MSGLIENSLQLWMLHLLVVLAFLLVMVVVAFFLFSLCEYNVRRIDESFHFRVFKKNKKKQKLSGDQLVRTDSTLCGQGSVHSGSASWDDCGRAFLLTSCVWARFPDEFPHYASRYICWQEFCLCNFLPKPFRLIQLYFTHKPLQTYTVTSSMNRETERFFFFKVCLILFCPHATLEVD